MRKYYFNFYQSFYGLTKNSSAAVICGEPLPITNATVAVQRYTFGGSATYSCDAGFEAAAGGGDVVTCEQDGRWSNTSFYCRRQ